MEAAQKDIPWQIPSEPDLLRDKDGAPLLSEEDRTKRLALGVLGGFLLDSVRRCYGTTTAGYFSFHGGFAGASECLAAGNAPFNETALEIGPAEDNASAGKGAQTQTNRGFDRAVETLYTKFGFWRPIHPFARLS